MGQTGEIAIHQQGQKQEKATKLRREPVRRQGELAAIGDGSRRGMDGGGTFVILAPWQAGDALIVQDLLDGGGTQGGLLVLQSAFQFPLIGKPKFP